MISRVLPSNSADLALSANIFCYNTLLAKTYTAFQLSYELKCIIGRYLEFHCPLKAIWLINIPHAPPSSFLYGILDMPRQRCDHTYRDMLHNIHGMLTTVSGRSSLVRDFLWSIRLCSIWAFLEIAQFCCHLSITSFTILTGFERSIPHLVSRFLLSTSTTSPKGIIPTITSVASVEVLQLIFITL